MKNDSPACLPPGKSRIRGWGKQKIRYELRQKGVSEYCIVKALKSLDETEYVAGFQTPGR